VKLRALYARYASFALGMTPQEAYELQRVLQMDERAAEAGLKATRSGPGGGAEATPFTVGFMLVGALVGGARSDAIRASWSYWNIGQYGSNKTGWINPATGQMEPPAHIALCPLTRQHSFGEAIKFLLANPSHAELVDRVEVWRDIKDASIYYRADDGRVERSRFLESYNKSRVEQTERAGGLRVLASIGGGPLAAIATDLREATPAQ
jgi:hypothetical protein